MIQSDLNYAKILSDATTELETWLADGDPDKGSLDDYLIELVGESVPSSTTVLFGLVLADNSLAFCPSDSVGVEPFSVLSDAVAVRLWNELSDHAEARADETAGAEFAGVKMIVRPELNPKRY